MLASRMLQLYPADSKRRTNRQIANCNSCLCTLFHAAIQSEELAESRIIFVQRPYWKTISFVDFEVAKERLVWHFGHRISFFSGQLSVTETLRLFLQGKVLIHFHGGVAGFAPFLRNDSLVIQLVTFLRPDNRSPWTSNRPFVQPGLNFQ